MRYLTLTLMAVTVVAATQDEAKSQICVPGTRSNVDCYYCVCSMDGTRQDCTWMMCPPKIPDVRVLRQVTEKVCQPGSTKKGDCNNNCWCSEDGTTWVCTEIACAPKDQQTTEKCQPGDKIRIGYVKCRCVEDGSSNYNWDCSLGDASKRRLRRQAVQKNCQPGVTKIIDCLNYFTFLPGDQLGICSPNTTYKKHCNTCTCAADGLTENCTKTDYSKVIYNQDDNVHKPVHL